MTRKPKHPRRQTVDRARKLAFVKAHPELWATPIQLAKEMMRAGLYAPQSITRVRGPVARMLAQVSGRLKEGGLC